MATNLEIVKKDVEASKEAISHQLLDFQAQAQANHNILHAQLSELVNLPYDDLIAQWDAERPVVIASDTDEYVETMDVGAAGGDQQVQFSEEEPEDVEMREAKQVDELIDADEKMSLEDILMTIPVDVPLASAGIEITKITMGKEIKILGVDEKTQYLASLPTIPTDDKGKKILVERDPVKGNPAKEHYYLICADIDLLVHLRAQVIDAVDQFFHSFSFKKLATINIEELSKKEEQVLCWGETETTHVALNKKRYILLKFREVLIRKFLESWKNNFVPGKGSSAIDLKVIDMLSDLHLFVLEELREQALAQGIKWTRTCCSKIFEASPRDCGAIIAKTNTNTPSTCWLRKMILVDGVWVVEPFCDQWVKIPRPVVCTEVSRQCSFVDFFPVVSEPFRLLRKRWADVCLEFQAQTQANHNILHAQLSELVAYINRGGDNKKGESSSSRGPQPPPPPVDQIRGTGANVSIPDFAQRVDVAQRNIMERVMDTDRRESLLEAERDRERRRRELSGSKRRRRH
ncbi:hypothetical protein F511_42876 [Dorcoceras hygrometricum]|uniref:Uncharacterized protein n=1 Tax=Dorcoceras hygrometricum TaxID=472368 RepID=A0A2Z7BTC0_9LAMI|nr:hypothetical protein F511_42876 [Dorcoceras hygrometricum]